MSTFFGHGRLRLYLLKLLDESPRHGYEIISLLRDRFLGVYSPSPGTIYPRLARLEEEGLVTHTEEGGRKVYSLTDKGREELRAREGDLHDLEREITDSVRDIARAVKKDVRETIGSLREELKFAAGGARRADSERASSERTAPKAPAEETPTAERKESPGGEKARSGEETREERERDRSCDDGTRWSREWERFAQGFGAFGAVWGRGGAERSSEFEQALHDFSDRVRDVAREAGTVGEAAVHDLRRILDDTVEVIRRDVRHWGPPHEEGTEGSGDGPDTPEPGSTGTKAPEPGSGTGRSEPKAAGPEAPAAEKPEAKESEAEEPKAARPMPQAGGDPWSQVVDDPADRSDEK
ncbi:PadR family transcriptional regulator [Nocardiopsis sp. N85]|uniref:PadR family transcriptional regulator n=1 Tax=Nocardiopsis sp. N85 TaxID=3029400 RepID=UPI00237F2153|nr:PadR family transcriptional regulator [Nocardiopsis sp. N85]MDE3720955.1 PadR family transcriptional regulator [Nocardiopsis sp. N85]